MMKSKSKLALGTVQFGLDYGISNTQGRTPEAEVRAILDYAFNHGVNMLDTAPLYGNSEEVLGRNITENLIDIVTKTNIVTNDIVRNEDVELLRSTFLKSLELLKHEQAYGLMLHHVDDLFKPRGDALFKEMQRLRYQGLTRKIGVSVYTEEQIERVLGYYDIDIIQVPINVFDQRLLHNGILDTLKKRDIEIHARSAFLQGLLLMKSQSLPEYFAPVRKMLADFHNYLAQKCLTPVQGALSFICGLPQIDYVVCGVNSLSHWKELINSVDCAVDFREFARFSVNDPSILNPSLWRL
ncbi:MAG: aryl-alcohol dehydrogenase [Candidatus Electrothrix sp. AUS1_2]|nr:aryl-alcohol dehydrogenase [Candidatus Electrothrix sp. AUS1_2]